MVRSHFAAYRYQFNHIPFGPNVNTESHASRQCVGAPDGVAEAGTLKGLSTGHRIGTETCYFTGGPVR